VVPSSLVVLSSSKISCVLLTLEEEEDRTILRKVEVHLANDTTSHVRRLESSTTGQ
jgi:hypothetical protein